MAAWYLAPSLSVLRGEVDTRWPRRDHTSDGTVGDTAHQARESDHNPNARNSVDAWDMDKDGVDVWEVIRAFQAHPSSHYWIWNREIADRDTGWRRRAYGGDNPHTQHVHFSIKQTAAAEQNRQAWGLLEDEMDAAEFVKILDDPRVQARMRAEFVKILDDPRVQARMRALPWQYAGGGIPPGMSTLSVLNGTYVYSKAAAEAPDVPGDLVATLDRILAAAQDDGDVTVNVSAEVAAELARIREVVNALPAEVRDAIGDAFAGGAAATQQ